MQLDHQQLRFWYGTPDAPAPLDDEIAGRRAVAVTIAVQPPSLRNTVEVRYRVDQGPIQAVRAVRLRTDRAQGTDYYRAIFPDFWTGEQVSYVPIVSCAGRRAPDPETAAALPSSFRLTSTPVAIARVASEPTREDRTSWTAPAQRLAFAVDYLASIGVPLKEPELIGVTPEGIMVNWYWYPEEGVVRGPQLNAKVRQLGGDWMTIRRDGIGLMDVRATLETSEGALLFVHYAGYYDLGENGYQDFLERRWPARAPTRTTPRFHTSHPRYLWLNRTQCIGIGEVRMQELAYTYDLYALR